MNVINRTLFLSFLFFFINSSIFCQTETIKQDGLEYQIVVNLTDFLSQIFTENIIDEESIRAIQRAYYEGESLSNLLSEYVPDKLNNSDFYKVSTRDALAVQSKSIEQFIEEKLVHIHQELATILNQRLERNSIEKYKVINQKNYILIQIYFPKKGGFSGEESQYHQKLLSAQGKLELYEVWAVQDGQVIEDFLRGLTNYNSSLSVQYLYNGFAVPKQEIETLKGYLEQWEKENPNNQYLWGKSSAYDWSDEEYDFFYLVKTSKEGKAALTNFVNAVELDKNKHYTGINIKVEDKEQLRKVTAENIGKCIALSIDEYVYTAPIVQEEIAGGEITLSGVFDEKEINQLLNLLRSKPSPVKLVWWSVDTFKE